MEHMCLDEIFEDVICQNGSEIVEPGDRFNRGVAIGITGCQSVDKSKSKPIGTPYVMRGTSRYANCFGTITACALDLIERL